MAVMGTCTRTPPCRGLIELSRLDVVNLQTDAANELYRLEDTSFRDLSNIGWSQTDFLYFE